MTHTKAKSFESCFFGERKREGRKKERKKERKRERGVSQFRVSKP